MIGGARRLLLGASLTALLAPGIAVAKPGEIVVVHGTVVERYDNLLVIKGDNGRTYYADVAAVDRATVSGLKPGDPAFVRGTEGTYPNEIRASVAELDRVRASRPAPAPTPSAANDVFSHRDWSLPVSHRYELFDRAAGTYTQVDIRGVPSRVARGEWIYDRTAGRWVAHPSVGRDPAYLAGGRASAVTPGDPQKLTYWDWRLPRSHRYEAYDPATGAYTQVELLSVPSRVERGEWIFDRTASQWVSHSTMGGGSGGRNPAYLAAESAPADPHVLVHRDWRLPRSHTYESYNTATGAYTMVDPSSLPARLDRGEYIYDRTTRQWVAHPSVGRNPAYLAAATGGAVVPASLPADADRLVDKDWRLPKAHRYETYDPATGKYAEVDVAGVPMRIDRGEWIFDRTAGQWVSHPSTGRNPAYLAARVAPAPGVAAVAADSNTFVYENWRLARSHRYDTYDPVSGQYTNVDVASIPARIERGEWIYDRTANLWVSHSGMRINDTYLEKRLFGTVQSVVGSTATITADDGTTLTVDTSRLVPPASLVVGDRVEVIGSYQGGSTLIAGSVRRPSAAAPAPPPQPAASRHKTTDGR